MNLKNLFVILLGYYAEVFVAECGVMRADVIR